jgi:hypothetical protein
MCVASLVPRHREKSDAIRQHVPKPGLRVVLDATIDRKGLDVVVLVWRKEAVQVTTFVT